MTNNNNTSDDATSTTESRSPAGGQGFTPGSWLAVKGHDDDPERWAVVVDGPEQFFVAVIENGAPGDTLETEGANARLIAESPAMFDLLRRMVAEEDRLESTGDVVTSIGDLIEEGRQILSRVTPNGT